MPADPAINSSSSSVNPVLSGVDTVFAARKPGGVGGGVAAPPLALPEWRDVAAGG
ncbi:MAG: hypothetical protein ACR2OG_05350 [Gemmatimonadaceae bacterium]